ncbi:MAG: class I SAM-dependent methyltransferase [Aquabacterium sp.]|uniref:class I SAM-dependent methyltransferase n=1 Tax=Aquabacterium sp. TaxID=1872578 RepID=UPI0011FBCE99|nr:class I SAM-dependent methyltransferase [Aquabacterium sp.]TAK81873.1 MAG: class I SAM-dependent methyltransferase [Aquabacterium sp.]
MSTNAKLNTSRLLLSKLREGDYAHAGDEEAIDIVLRDVFAFVPSLKEEAVLDVGSGFGGTASYLTRMGFTNVQGFDLDEAAVDYAKEKYRHITFKVADALKINQSYAPQSFSFLSLLNVIYAIQDKECLLKNLATLSKPGGILALFDYAQTKESLTYSVKDLAGNPMYPVHMSTIEQDFKTAGWKLLRTTDMTSHFIRWYRTFLDKLSDQVSILQQEFASQDIQKVQATFAFLLDQFEKGYLGGVIIYAQKKETECADRRII